MIKPFIAIFIGGGLGSVMRYGLQLMLHERIVPYNFPWATFSVNVVGSFLIGLFYAVSAKFNISDEVRLFLTAGLCGGFTTFSTFSNDSVAMMKHGDGTLCIIYILLSVVAGMMACWLGAYTGDVMK